MLDRLNPVTMLCRRSSLLGVLLIVAAAHPLAVGAPVDELEDKDYLHDLPGDDLSRPAPTSPTPEVAPPEVKRISEEDLPPWKRFSGLVAAETAMRSGDTTKAMEHLRNATAANPYLPPVNVIFAQMLMAHGQQQAGRRMLEEASVQYPDHPAVYILFGQSALRDGRFNDAQLNFDKAETLTLPENWPEELQQNKHHAVLQGKARVAEARGRWHEAEEALRQLAMKSPTDASLRSRWATALFHTGQEKVAYDEFDRAHRQDAKLDMPEIAIATLFMQTEKYQRANAVYQRILKAHPDDPKINAEAASAMLMQGKTAEAKQLADEAAELGFAAPEFAMLRGMIASQLGEFPAAEAFFTNVLRDAPNNLEAKCQLAIALGQQNETAKRTEAMREAALLVRQFSWSDRALSTAGWIKFNSGQVEEAEPLLRAGVVSGSPHPESVYFLARFLYEQNHREEAQRLIDSLRPLVDQPGHFVRRLDARQWLTKIDATNVDG